MENFSPVRKTLSFGSPGSPPSSPVRNPFADLNGPPEVRKSLFGSPKMRTGCSQRMRFPPKKMGPQPPNHNCNRGRTANLFPEGTEIVGEIPQQASAHSCCVAGFRSFMMLTEHWFNQPGLQFFREQEERWQMGAPSFNRYIPEMAQMLGIDLGKLAEKIDELRCVVQLKVGTYLLTITDCLPGGVESHVIVIQKKADGQILVYDSQSGWVGDMTPFPEVVEAWFRGIEYPGDTDEGVLAHGWFVPASE